ncbi:hypothetical protein [Bradyrhizobium sp. HKCCYLR20261]|uniref:hypothetical protein n=1 Tax=Bradyrhizobium sp. HKCCYLR20261 TaxID=3420760 RepID=UPI003EB7936E
MTTVLGVYDAQRPGAERELRHRLALPRQRITARDLIRCRIEADVALHNTAESARIEARIAAADDDFASAWLVKPGEVEQTLNGPRGAYGPGVPARKSPVVVRSEPLVATALAAFARSGFFMIFDGRQIEDLDEVLTVEPDSAVTFLRLVPLVGG